MRTHAEKPKANQQTQQSVATQASRAISETSRENPTAARFRHDFSNVPVFSGSRGAIQTYTTVDRYAFSATIRRGMPILTSKQPKIGESRMDAARGQEQGGEQYAVLFEQLGTSSPGTTNQNVEASSEMVLAPFQIPDIEVPALAELEKTDAVKGTFTYRGSITRGGAAPSGFGVTRSFGSKLTGITITPKTRSFEVVAILEHPITYQIRSGTGPDSQVDIASATDADLTKTNYPTAVSDLTPDMSDLNGRPPRTKFWAEDLTVKHELVHANDDKGNGPGAKTTVTTWLNGQTAASEGEVRTLLAAIPGRFASALLAALSTEDGEKHAYGDGAPSYKARADAIKAKGDRGDYK